MPSVKVQKFCSRTHWPNANSNSNSKFNMMPREAESTSDCALVQSAMPYSQLTHNCTHDPWRIGLLRIRCLAHALHNLPVMIVFRSGRVRAGAHAKLICSCAVVAITLAQKALDLAAVRHHFRTGATSHGKGSLHLSR